MNESASTLLSLIIFLAGSSKFIVSGQCNKAVCPGGKAEFPPVNLDTYYSSTAGLSGGRLKAKLNEIIRDHKRYTYKCVSVALEETDQDPENPNNVIAFYTKKSIPITRRDCGQNDDDSWNREHVWVKSHGFPRESQHAYTDLHHLRPADRSVNSARGDKDFKEGGIQHSECKKCKFDSDANTWEPPNSTKGETARMLLYMDVRYEGNDEDRTRTPDLKLVDRSTKNIKEAELGHLSDLLQWHCEYPVSDEERLRNDIVYSWQGNRNPFIDRPEFVESIWNISCNKTIETDDEISGVLPPWLAAVQDDLPSWLFDWLRSMLLRSTPSTEL